MDLASLDTVKKSSSGTFMPIKHPVTDEVVMDEATKKPVAICLRGLDSPEYAAAQFRMADRRISKAVKKGRVDANAMRAEDVYNEQLDLLLDCTVGWEGVQLDGVTLEYNRDNARKLYLRLPFLREQAQTFIENRANFLGN